MNKIQDSPSQLAALYDFMIPSEYLSCFEVHEIKYESSEMIIVLVEKTNLIPKDLEGKAVVLDGFNDSIDILSHSFSVKGLVYLRLIRRKWKEAGTVKSYSNTYDLHHKGIKTTREFSTFLKGSH